MRTRFALLVFVIATLWATAIFAAPRLVDRRLFQGFGAIHVDGPPSLTQAAGALVYLTGSFICHQRSERSFHDGAVPLPVCARCTGLYVAAPFGILATLMASRRTARARPGAADAYRRWRWMLSLAALPTVVSIVVERAGGPSDLTSRALAALPLGAALAACLAAAVLGHFALASRRVAEPRAGV